MQTESDIEGVSASGNNQSYPLVMQASRQFSQENDDEVLNNRSN